MRDVLIATSNAHKIREIQEILAPTGMVLHAPKAWAAARGLPPPPEVIEDGLTFLANAQKKARALSSWSGLPAIADDSGLEVDALGGEPGVYSARWAGESGAGADDANNNKLVRCIGAVPQHLRTARYRCAVVFVDPQGEEVSAEGSCEGQITDVARGAGGFGYDPYFLVDGDAAGRTMAELQAAEKHSLSHRGRAIRTLVATLAERPL